MSEEHEINNLFDLDNFPVSHYYEDFSLMVKIGSKKYYLGDVKEKNAKYHFYILWSLTELSF